jgi:oligopeptide transport system ATP-binding protein
MSLLEVRGLQTHFPLTGRWLFGAPRGVVRAVDGVDLDLDPGEILGLVGESGCGKSTLGRTILQLERPTGGRVLFEGQDLASLGAAELRRRRRDFQMVFQDPYSSLNPRRTVFETLAEPLLAHGLVERRRVPEVVAGLMEQVELSPRFVRKYPHEFSGGQRQRIAIARALTVGPRLLVADEPVSALDVSVQAGILNLFGRLCRERNLALLMVSHNLAVVRHLSHRIAVMYLGRIIESGPAAEVFETPRHPYTRALIQAIPEPDPRRKHERIAPEVRGEPPSPSAPPPGCAFHPRCLFAQPQCRAQRPECESCGLGRQVACLRWREI